MADFFNMSTSLCIIFVISRILLYISTELQVHYVGLCWPRKGINPNQSHLHYTD